MWKTILVGVAAIPILALLGGVGLLAWRIGESWDVRSTDTLIAGLVMSCASGAVVLGVLLALIVGVPLALRAYERGDPIRRVWAEPPVPRWPALSSADQRSPWIDQPPVLTDKRQGQWLSQGAQQYDLWGDEPVDKDWSEQDRKYW